MTKHSSKFVIPFADKESPTFSAYIRRLAAAHSGPVILFTPRTASCGAITVPSLDWVNFSFPFDLNKEGILSILTADLSDRMLLDFFQEDEGPNLLEIEVQGDYWPGVRFQF